MALRGETVGTAYVRIIALGEGLDKSIAKEVRDAADDVEVERSSQDLGTRIEENVAEGVRDSNETDHVWEEKSSRWKQLFDRLTPAITGDIKDVDNATGNFLTRFGRNLQRTNIDADHFGDTTERLFGRRSRNDFINFTGAFIGNATRGVLGMVNGLKNLTGQAFEAAGSFKDFLSKVDLARNGMLKWGDVFASEGGAIASFATKAGPVAAGLIVVIAAALGPIAGLISGLAAAITALAGSVAFALSAGVGVLVGLLPALALGVGAVVLAFKGLDKKKVAGFFAEFKEPLARLKKALGQDLLDAIDAALPGIRSGFDQLFPILRSVGGVIHDAGVQFSELFTGNAFIAFSDQLSSSVKPILDDLLDVVFNLTRSFMGIFQAAAPLAEDFAQFLADVTGQFAAWTESIQGQATLDDFFKRAADSAKAVGQFVGDIIVLIAQLFDAGQGSGNTIFDDMTKKLSELINFIRDNPETIAEWFKGGVEIARSVGDAIKGVIDFFAALDTPQNREAAANIINAIALITEGIAGFVGFIEMIFSPFVKLWTDELQKIADAFQALFDFLFGHSIIPDMMEGFREFFKFIRGGFNFIKGLLDRVGGWFRDLGIAVAETFQKVREWIGKGVNFIRELPGKVKGILDNVAGFFKDLPGKVGEALLNASGKIADFVGRARDKFGDFVSAVREKVSSAISFAKDKIGELPGFITNLIGRVFTAAQNLGGAIIDGLQAALAGAGDIASGIGSAIAGVINGLIDQLNAALEFSIDVGPKTFTINPPDIGHIFGQGGIVDTPTRGIFGDRGAEALVPLDIPLSQVDPSVLELARFARGLPTTSQATTNNKGIDVGGITIVTPTDDPAAVARETINQLVASSYFG